MPIVPSFTATQIIGQPSVILFTDTSTGSDSNVVERNIYLITDDGMYFTAAGKSVDPTYTVWPLATNPFYLDILPKDMAFTINVTWVDAAGFRLINDTDFRLINSTDKILI